MAAPIRVLIVDDDPEFVESLSALLALDDEIEVVGTAANGQDAVLRAIWLRPDIVTMDIEMPRMDGVEATKEIRANLPRTRVILVSASQYAGRAETARTAGASAYVTKSRTVEELITTIHAVAEGENFIIAF